MKTNSQILVIDSGIGGISVLRELRKVLPNEDYVYFGDSKNAPYGEKTKNEILGFATDNISRLIKEYDIKACVVACNTLSVNCLEDIQKKFADLSIIGIVPNYEDPIMDNEKGKVLILSTPLTSKSKYLSSINSNRVLSIGMPGLVRLIENMNFDNKVFAEYFDENLLPFLDKDVVAISLGCTHYPFIKGILDDYLVDKGFNVKFYDGIDKTINNLMFELKNKSLLNEKEIEGDLIMLNSSMDDTMIEKSFELLSL